LPRRAPVEESDCSCRCDPSGWNLILNFPTPPFIKGGRGGITKLDLLKEIMLTIAKTLLYSLS
jgi:hypothetical protein